MLSQGPKIAGTGADDSSFGDADAVCVWSAPGNITADDGSMSTVSLGSLGTNNESHYLKATNFAFTIPPTAVIRGIQVTVEVREATGGGTECDDNAARMVKAGTVQGDNKASAAAFSTSFGATRVYGSSNDLWGLTWKAADINASNFGFVYAVVRVGGPTQIAVDRISIQVWYDLTDSGGVV